MQGQHRHAPSLHGGPGLRDGRRLRPKLVEQREQSGLIGAHTRLALQGTRVVGGVADLVATVTLHDTERAVLHHDALQGLQCAPLWQSHRAAAEGDSHAHA